MDNLDFLFEPQPDGNRTTAFLEAYHLPFNPGVLKNLHSIYRWLSTHFAADDFFLLILDKVSETAAPEQALNQLERFFSQLPSPEPFLALFLKHPHALQTLSTLLGASPYLTGIVLNEPDLFVWLMKEEVWQTPLHRESLVREILEQCRGMGTIEEAYPVLRQMKRRQILRIGAKDLTGFADFTETTGGLTTLAEATLEAAYQVADSFMKRRYGTPQVADDQGRAQECPFVILGMGKLGGGELNFSSDIDLLYLYESDRGETTGVLDDGGDQPHGRVENHIYFGRLCERITDLMHANTEDGFVFRVDLRLRPEGAQGPVASSLRSYELYYESFGQTWERAAHLKCRPVAGSMALGRTFNDLLKPFVFRKYLDYRAIDEIKELKGKIIRQLQQKRGRGYNVKLGHGGIREIEFFVQALQLIYGGRIAWIREKNTLRALHRLCDKELVTYDDFQSLSHAYLFLRDVEHKLQIENQLQTQTLPTDPVKVDQLARRCGCDDAPSFEALLEEHKARVQFCFDNLFYEKAQEGPEVDSPMEGVLRGDATAKEGKRLLSSLGFTNASLAYKTIGLLREGPPYRHSSSRCRALFLKAAPAILQTMAASPDPDMALAHLERFLSEYSAPESLYEILGANPPALERLIALFSMSSYLSHLLIRHQDAMEILLGKDLVGPAPGLAELRETMMQGLDSQTSSFLQIDSIRRFKRVEEMKIGLRDIMMNTNLMETARALSDLADTCLEGAYRVAWQELVHRHGKPAGPAGEDGRFAIMAAGKLGSRELTYGADLDLLFVYSDDGETEGPKPIANRDFFSKLSGRVVSILSSLSSEGITYRIDLRLRPLGEAGPLVQSVEGYANYFRRNLQTWERQAMTRVRFTAGHGGTGARLMTLIEDTLYEAPPADDLKASVFEMRMRIEREKSKLGGKTLYFKTGAGGLIDIEFLVQYWQLSHGHRAPEIRAQAPMAVLQAARQLDLVSEADFDALKNAYLFLRHLESRARIVQDRPVTSLSSEPAKNRALALRMGYTKQAEASPGEQLLTDYQEMTRKTREIFIRFLGPSDNGDT